MSLDVPIKKVMTTQVVSITPNTALKEIGELFKQHDFHHLPVADAKNKVLGIISREDFSKVAYQIMSAATEDQQGSVMEIHAKDIMSSNPITLSMHNELGEAIEIFLQNKIRAIIIQDDGELQGILSAYDALSFMYQVLTSQEIFNRELMRDADDDWGWDLTWEDFFD